MASSDLNQLSAQERMISVRLALVFALRMFGLFVVLPVLAPYALTLPLGGGASPFACCCTPADPALSASPRHLAPPPIPRHARQRSDT